MQIPLEKVTDKMKRELQQLSTCSNERDIRDHALIIRSLCDLLLDEQERALPVVQTERAVTQSTLPTYIENQGQSGSLLDF